MKTKAALPTQVQVSSTSSQAEKVMGELTPYKQLYKVFTHRKKPGSYRNNAELGLCLSVRSYVVAFETVKTFNTGRSRAAERFRSLKQSGM